MAAADMRSGPRIILVEPQMGENIGAAARAMLNCGLGDLAIVRPRDGWPNPKALAMASGAEAVLEKARLCVTIAEATADLPRVYAMSARPRDMVQRVLTPRAAAAELRQAQAAGEKAGILFGPERAGLTNEQMARAQAVITVPLNPAFASLNLAQAVLIAAYEWFLAGVDAPPERLLAGATGPADQAALGFFLDRLEGELGRAGYFPSGEQRPVMRRNLFNLLTRAALTKQELRTLHGVVSALAGLRRERL